MSSFSSLSMKMIHVNVNLHDNFHSDTNRASRIPVHALKSSWRSLVDGFLSMGPTSLLIFIALPMPHSMGSSISKIREVLQDAPKASALRKSELCWFRRDRRNGLLCLSVPLTVAELQRSSPCAWVFHEVLSTFCEEPHDSS